VDVFSCSILFFYLWPQGHAVSNANGDRPAKLDAEGEAFFLPNQRQRRLIQSAAGSALEGADCWQRLAFFGVCRLREALGRAGRGEAPKRGWEPEFF
jgi:hypothetical protein